MVTSICLESNEYPYIQTEWSMPDTHHRILATNKHLHIGERHVSLVLGTQYTGLNQYSKKRYYRWSNQSYGFTRQKHVIPFASDRKRVWNTFAYLGATETTIQPEFSAAVKDKFKIETLADVYPIAGMYNINLYMDLPPNIRKYMYETDFKNFIVRVFGKTRYRKDLLKACATHGAKATAYAADLRGLCPTDWIIPQQELDNYIPMRELYRILDPRSFKPLLANGYNFDAAFNINHQLKNYFFHDWKERLAGTRVRSWGELEEIVAPVQRYGFKPFKDEKINPPSWIEGSEFINGIDYEGVVWAGSTQQMKDWGKEMGNCIGGYITTAAAGTEWFGAIYKDDKLWANFQVGYEYPKSSARGSNQKKLKLIQLLGKFNKHLPAEDIEPIEAAFKKAKINCGQYWGKPTRYTLGQIGDLAVAIDNLNEPVARMQVAFNNLNEVLGNEPF